jgi:plastocyanin
MKAFRILGLVLVAAFAAAGCGGGGGGESKTTNTATTQAPTATTTSVKLAEYSFDPKDVVVKRGTTLKVENGGAIAHNLTVEQGPDPKKKTKKLAGTPTFLPNKTENLKVSLKPGKYAMVCTVTGHRELGMVGTFTVK